MTGSVIVAAVRTPVGRFGSALRSCSAVDLGAVAIAEAGGETDPGVLPELVDGARPPGDPEDDDLPLPRRELVERQEDPAQGREPSEEKRVMGERREDVQRAAVE